MADDLDIITITDPDVVETDTPAEPEIVLELDVDDSDVGVTIEVEDVDSSVLDGAIAAALEAAARAEAAAAAAEQMVEIHQGPEGPRGIGFASVTSQEDGTMVITLTNGDSLTIDLNHLHQQYPKYVLCESEEAYQAIQNKDPETLYLIPETE